MTVPENCKSKYSLDANGLESKKIDDYIKAGNTAIRNEDYRNATIFFKKALEINPNDGRVFHYYNYSSDLYYLMRAGTKGIPILIKSIYGKMGTVIDMYNSISMSILFYIYVLKYLTKRNREL